MAKGSQSSKRSVSEDSDARRKQQDTIKKNLAATQRKLNKQVAS